LCDDAKNHRFNIRQHFLCRDTHDHEPAIGEPGIAHLVKDRPIAAIMRLAVDLDNQPRRLAEEVRDIRPGRMLPAEFETARSLTQLAP